MSIGETGFERRKATCLEQRVHPARLLRRGGNLLKKEGCVEKGVRCRVEKTKLGGSSRRPSYDRPGPNRELLGQRSGCHAQGGGKGVTQLIPSSALSAKDFSGKEII